MVDKFSLAQGLDNLIDLSFAIPNFVFKKVNSLVSSQVRLACRSLFLCSCLVEGTGPYSVK